MSSFEPYPLTELDHLLMPVYVHLFLTFETSSTEDSLARLENAISRLITEWPFLAGTITKPDPERQHQNAYQVQPPSKSELQANPMLRIKFHHAPVSIMNHAEETPEALIPVKPRSPTPYPAPALRFQANVMTDGIILAASWHHRFMDICGCQAAFEGLSHFCRDGGGAGVIFQTNPLIQETTRQQISNFGGVVKTPAAFADTYASAYAKSQYQKNQVILGYVLCPEKVRILQEMCKSPLAALGRSSKTRLTCDDIVTSIIWLAAGNARNRAYSNPRTSLSRYVSVRKVLEPSISTTFFGNAVALSRPDCNVYELPSATQSPDIPGCEVVPGLALELVNDLSHVAWLGGSADTGIDASHVGDLVSTLRASDDWDSMTIAPVDVSVSSLRKVAVYDLNFGESFGPVKEVDFLESNLQRTVCY